MRIFTYATGSEDLPQHERAIARIKTPMPTGFGKTRAVRDGWHPVIFYAATTADAHAKAEAWWEAELAKERLKVANAEKRATARAAAKAVLTNQPATAGDAAQVVGTDPGTNPENGAS